MKTFLPKSGLLTFVFLITNLFFASGVFAQATATVSTDLLDYPPGSAAIITGSGWKPGETVSFHFDEDPMPATCMLSHDITTVAYANGCVATCTTEIYAEDVRCFAGKSSNVKVKMCHQTGSPKNPCIEICVDESAVVTHLAHGDFVGTCGSNCAGMAHLRPVVIGKEEIIEISEFNVIAYPNPSNHQFTLAVQGGSDEQLEVVVYDMLARVVKRIAKPNAKDIQFGEGLPSGEYLLLIRQGENQKAINVIKK